jgi:hypothetical protein
MSPALLLALVLAQAEAAPPEPPPPAPAAEPGPAEPAPPEPVAAVDEPEPPAHLIGIAFGGGRRLDPAGTEVPPAHGLSVATMLVRRYLLVGRLELGLGFHFAFQRYARDVTITIMSGGQTISYDDIRTLTYYDLALAHTVSLPLYGGRVRPFALLGGGVTLAHFSTLETELGEARAVRPIVRGAAGLEFAVAGPETRVGLELDYTRLFRAPPLATTGGQQRTVFGDRVAANVWLRHAF